MEQQYISTTDEKLYQSIVNGNFYPEEVPFGFQEKYPELFLSEDAPLKMKNDFYYSGKQANLFSLIQEHEWDISFLEEKNILPFFRRSKRSYEEYFELFQKDALSFGLSHSQLVIHMISQKKVKHLWNWYQKNQTWFPSVSVMEHLPETEIDAFLFTFSKWTKLRKAFSNEEKDIQALLTLAFQMGVFHRNETGYNKLLFELKRLPRYYSADSFLIMKKHFDQLEISTSSRLRSYAIAEGLIDKSDASQTVLPSLYQKEKDGNYYLRKDITKYPFTKKIVREIFDHLFEKNQEIDWKHDPYLKRTLLQQLSKLLTMDKDSAFTNFLVRNFDEVIRCPELFSKMGTIQKLFPDIKERYSKENQTVRNILCYIGSSTFQNCLPGNCDLASFSYNQGYSQKKFLKLQSYYEQGKRRLYSSIPYIEGEKEGIHYQILRLDDLRHLEIGSLTNCCQRLGFLGESCMLHSMVDSNGRAFVLFDPNGEVEALSWVWRNGNTICFDNIELSKYKKFKEEDYDRVKAIYEEATEKIQQEDRIHYGSYFVSGNISQEDLQNYMVARITLGEGETDRNLHFHKLDSNPAKPLASGLGDLYITDSQKQYTLYQNERKITEGQSPIFYFDPVQKRSVRSLSKKELEQFQEMKLSREIWLEHPDITLTNAMLQRAKETSSMLDLYLPDEDCSILLTPSLALVFQEERATVKIKDVVSYWKPDDVSYQEHLNHLLQQLGKDGKEVVLNETTPSRRSVSKTLCSKSFYP